MQSRGSGTTISRMLFVQVSEKTVICFQAEIWGYEIPGFSFERKKASLYQNHASFIFPDQSQVIRISLTIYVIQLRRNNLLDWAY